MKTKYIINPIVLCSLAFFASFALNAAPATLDVRVDQPGHRISPLLWGIFFEDINLSADGGIYPELVRNRSFEDAEKPSFWKLTNAESGQSEMAIDNAHPLNPFNRRSLRVRVDGACSLVNEGYWGMALVKGDHYQVRLAARAADGFKGPLTILLENQSGRDFAKGEITDRKSVV